MKGERKAALIAWTNTSARTIERRMEGLDAEHELAAVASSPAELLGLEQLESISAEDAQAVVDEFHEAKRSLKRG